MNVFVYSVFDRKAAVFGTLMFFANDDMAKRACADTMRAGGDFPMLHYPDDFDCYLVGQFDTSTARLDGLQPVLVCRFSEFVVKGN